MNDKDIQVEAHKAFEDLKTGKDKNDLSALVSDIDSAKAKMTPQEYNKYLTDLNKETAKILPQVEIEGTTARHSLVVTDHHHDVHSILRPDDAKLLSDVKPNQEGIGRHEKRGVCDVTVNEQGELTSAKDPRTGDVFVKHADGKWTERSSYGHEREVANVQVDNKGNLTYEFEGSRMFHKADGSFGNESLTDGGQKEIYNNKAQLVEAPMGAEHTRKFHYDEKGDLDQIDGRLGHWDRKQDADGKTEWVNKNSGAVWKGDFTMDVSGNLIFKDRSGATWEFTISGTDERLK